MKKNGLFYVLSLILLISILTGCKNDQNIFVKSQDKLLGNAEGTFGGFNIAECVQALGLPVVKCSLSVGTNNIEVSGITWSNPNAITNGIYSLPVASVSSNSLDSKKAVFAIGQSGNQDLNYSNSRFNVTVNYNLKSDPSKILSELVSIELVLTSEMFSLFSLYFNTCIQDWDPQLVPYLDPFDFNNDDCLDLVDFNALRALFPRGVNTKP